MPRRCKYPECRHAVASRAWWEREPGYFRREELPRALARPALFSVTTLPCAGIAHDDKRVAAACAAQRHVGWWERPRRTVAGELAFQARRLAGQPAFPD